MSLHLVVGIRRAEKKSLWKSHGRTAFATAAGRRVKPPFGIPWPDFLLSIHRRAPSLAP